MALNYRPFFVFFWNSIWLATNPPLNRKFYIFQLFLIIGPLLYALITFRLIPSPIFIQLLILNILFYLICLAYFWSPCMQIFSVFYIHNLPYENSITIQYSVTNSAVQLLFTNYKWTEYQIQIVLKVAETNLYTFS